jgi:hypothetical protein
MARILLVDKKAGEESTMPAVVKTVPNKTRWSLRQGGDSIDTTLLELVETIAEDTEDDRLIVATVLRLLRNRRVRLIGNFRGRSIEAP